MTKDYLKIAIGYQIIIVSILLIGLGILYEINFLWQFGVIIIINELTIQKYRDKILYSDVKKAMRQILGIKNPETPLFPELVNLIRENEYHVVRREISEKNYYPKERINKHFNLASLSEEIAVVIPQYNNIHYSFERGSGEINEQVVIEKISCEELSHIDQEKGMNLEEFDPKNPEEILIHKENTNTFYKVCKQLRRDKIYRFKIITRYPPCISDLNMQGEGNENSDWIDYSFIMPTQTVSIECTFPFNLKEYNFHIKRTNLSRTKFKILNSSNRKALSFNYKNNKIKIFQENFDKGDTLRIIYSKI